MHQKLKFSINTNKNIVMKNKKNLVDTILDTQKNVVDNLVNTTKKIYGNNPGTEMLEKSTEMYNDWVEKQKESIETITEKTDNLKNKFESQAEKAKDFYTNWQNTQIENTKKLWEANQNFFNQMNNKTQNQKFDFFNNPMNFWSDAMKSYNQFINEMNNAQKWANLFNPSTYFNQFQQNFNNTPNIFNAYFEAVSQTTKEFQNAFSNLNKQDFFSQVSGNAANFGKFMEIWAPYWENIKNGSFSADMFKNQFSAEKLKELTDTMFQFLPDSFRSYFEQNNEFMKNFYTQNMDMSKSWMNQAKENWEQFQSSVNPFHTFMNQYNQWNQFLNSSAAPFAKMATPNAFSKSVNAWQSIFDKMTIFSVKNTELQYMMYLQGQKVMEALAENIQEKISNNTEITDFTQLYQEWLNISDKVYVELFESEEYSKLMAEVSSLQLKIKKEVDTQIEESISNLPVATKSELDELYKVIYELKKEVRQLEKMLELDNNAEDQPAVKSRAKKTAKNA